MNKIKYKRRKLFVLFLFLIFVSLVYHTLLRNRTSLLHQPDHKIELNQQPNQTKINFSEDHKVANRNETYLQITSKNNRIVENNSMNTMRTDSPFYDEKWIEHTKLILNDIGSYLNSTKRIEILEENGLSEQELQKEAIQIVNEKYTPEEGEKEMNRRVVALYILSHSIHFSSTSCLTLLKNKVSEFSLDNTKNQYIRVNLMYDVLALSKFCSRKDLVGTENFVSQNKTQLSKEMKAQIQMGIEYVKEEGI